MATVASPVDITGNIGQQLKLISLDQKFLCFDVEQVNDAKQTITLTRTSSKRVAWRIRTNAPTRYIVNPNSGVLDDNNETQKLDIELVNNRYNPQHKLVLQAIQLYDSESPKTIWKSERSKNHEYVQTINLEMSTTLLNLESTYQLNEQLSQISVQSVLEQSSTTGIDRFKELDSLCQMLKNDNEQCLANIEKMKKMKEILLLHLENRKQNNKKLTQNIEVNEPKHTQLLQKIKIQEQQLIELQKTKPDQNCSVM